MKKKIHMIVSIIFSTVGLIGFLNSTFMHDVLSGQPIFAFVLLLMGWFGITKFIYD
jgi:hypothetical protein